MQLKTSLIASAVGLALSFQAHANVLVPDSDLNNTGGSELVLTVFNPNDNTSYSRDLGVTFNQLIGGASLANFTADGALAGLNLSDPAFSWNVIAADGIVAGPTVAEYGARILTTSALQPALTNNDVEGSTTSASVFVDGLNILSTHDTIANGSSVSIQQTDGGNWLGGMRTLWKAEASGAIGSSMDFWLGTETLTQTAGRGGGTVISAAPSDPAIFTKLGTFSLTGAGTLSYTVAGGPPPSTVPVPAAAWLFGSGIVGLVGVARRRRQPAEVA